MLPHVGKLYPGLVIDRILDLQLDQAFLEISRDMIVSSGQYYYYTG